MMKSHHDFARPHLQSFASRLLQHTSEQTINASEEIVRLSADHYLSDTRFEQERQRLFMRLPLMLAASCELDTNSYKAMEVAGIPVLLLRDRQGQARAFLNSCPHRGAILSEGQGPATRFTCPYHGWTFGQDGKLAGYPLREAFGDVSDIRLTEFSTFESAGMVWVTLNPQPLVSPKAFFSGFDQLLDVFNLNDWTLLTRHELPGPNWKLCFDAHLDFYHLPVLHGRSFGPGMSPKAIYGYWGPHQRLSQPQNTKADIDDDINLFKLDPGHPDRWPLGSMMVGEWIIFPNVSINYFYRGGLGMLISQIIPGRRSDEAVTVQSYFVAGSPDESQHQAAAEQSAFLAHVVGDEDLPTSAGQQLAIQSGHFKEMILGRNEGGIQAFHGWIERVLETEDAELNELFAIEPGWRF